MDTVINLISETIQADTIGNQIPVKTLRQVYATAEPIAQNEFFKAQAIGIKPRAKLIVFFGDYQGEELLEWEGTEYSIYRTYQKDDLVELYAEKRLGNGQRT